MHIDGTNCILGRVASVAAKHALLGESIIITNCEKLVISGKRMSVIARYKQDSTLGNPENGPIFPRVPDRFVKRVCKRMLPHKRSRGRDALKRIRCYTGTRDVQEKPVVLNGVSVTKLPTLAKITVGDLCSILGGKWK